MAKREKRGDPLQEHLALLIFIGICEGVHHMHNNVDTFGGPFAHRDLKPHNVLLREDYTPVSKLIWNGLSFKRMQLRYNIVRYLQVLMDFGSVEPARLTISTHSQAQYLQDLAAERCSMPYRPPELFQVDSKFTIDERTDLWVNINFTILLATSMTMHHF